VPGKEGGDGALQRLDHVRRHHRDQQEEADADSLFTGVKLPDVIDQPLCAYRQDNDAEETRVAARDNVWLA
jgi:hypothetical protein